MAIQEGSGLKAKLMALALAAAALAGCGTRSETVTPRTATPLRVATLAPNAGQAPIYAASRLGQFGAGGLSVTLSQAATPTQSLSEVAGGSADLAVSTEPALLEARDRGLRVVSVAALVRQPLSAAIWLPDSGIRSPADFTTKPVGTLGLDYERAFAETLAASAGAHNARVPTRDVGQDPIGALTHHTVAALVGAYRNQEGVQLAPRRPTIKAVESGGVPLYNELVLVAREASLPHQGDQIRSFLGALVRGTRAIDQGNPTAVGAFVAADSALDPRSAKAALAQTQPLLVPPPPNPYGWQDPAAWPRFADWMRSHGLLVKPLAVQSAFTNRFLPGEGL